MSKLTMGLLILLYFIFTSKECKSQETNRCISKETCAKCIEEDPQCAWCGDEDYRVMQRARCDFVENLRKRNCIDLINPHNSIHIIKDLPLSMKGAKLDELVQIKPQRIKIKLRPNSPEMISVLFRQAVDYPVDLYYLMDLSYTMRDDKESLVRMSQSLATEMKKLTGNFRLGFGSFVDKVAAPFTNMHPARAENPCSSVAQCAKSYGFRNRMSLSDNILDFTNKVRESRISGNIDAPEGTMDAIMQAVVCKEEIGWRSKSRKLLVVVTDAEFHSAGDGKIGGIIKPNDGECHLDADGFYSESTNQDYPSVSQLNRKIKEYNINLIFAVTKEHEDHYQNLSKRLVGSKTAELAKDSSNVVDLIKEQYNAISSSVVLTDTAQWSNNIEISYQSRCLDGIYKTRNACNGVRPGNTVDFDANVRFSMCPPNREDWITEIEIHPIGLSEKLILDLELMCECECKKTQQEEENNRQKFCKGKGTYECGVCNCDSNAYGMECECDASGNQTNVDDSACRRGGEERLCSNRGDCQCGKCYCDERENPEEIYYGKYCECSNFNCDQIDKKICGGHGVCDCGTCRCYKGWKGPNCDCSDSTTNCVAENGGDICSGHGICDCGSCKCDETYYGKFCDDCLSCTTKCEEYNACIECQLHSEDQALRQKYCEHCRSTNVTVEFVDKVIVDATMMEKACAVRDEEGCAILFKYRMEDNDHLIIYTQEEKECPTPVDVVSITSATVGSIVLAGLVLLVMWKILTEIHDKREFAKFERDIQRANWDTGDNPIFVEPSSTFQNPSFGQQ